MDEILNQLGGLVLGSVPTMILFILLVIAYGLLVHGPLQRVLDERRARTTGAADQARGAIARAEAETTAYEEKLRAARLEIVNSREAKLKQWNAERDAALDEIRQASHEHIASARLDIEKSAADARKQIEVTSDELSSRVLNVVLPSGIAATEVAQ